MGAGRFARGILLADPRSWRCSCPHAGRRGSTKIFDQSPVESAMVMDGTSPYRLRNISAPQLARDWRRIGILANAKGIVQAIVCIPLGWHLENDQSGLPDAE